MYFNSTKTSKDNFWSFIAIFFFIILIYYPSYSQSNYEQVKDSLIQVARDHSRKSEFEKAFQAANELKEHIRTKTPVDSFEYSSYLNLMASINYYTGEYNSALDYWFRTEENARKFAGENSPFRAKSLNNLGIILRRMGRFNEAEKNLLEAHRIKSVILDSLDKGIAISHLNLGNFHYAIAQFDQALQHYNKAIEVSKIYKEEDISLYSDLCHSLGLVYEELGAYDRAKYYLEEANESIFSVYGKEYPNYYSDVHSIAVLHKKQLNFKEALRLFRYSCEGLEKEKGEDHPAVAMCLSNLANVYREMNMLDSSRHAHLKAIEIDKALYGESHPRHASNLHNYANLFSFEGRYTEALELLHEALAIRKEVLYEFAPFYLKNLSELGLVYSKLDSADMASQYYNELFNRLSIYIKNSFQFLSEAERQNFIRNVAYPFATKIISFTVDNPSDENKELCINSVLLLQGIQLMASEKTMEYVLSNDDSLAINYYYELKELQKHINKAFKKSVDKDLLDSLIFQRNEIEQDLVRQSNKFKLNINAYDFDLNDALKILNKDDVYINLVVVRQEKRDEDSLADLLITLLSPKNEVPKIIHLENIFDFNVSEEELDQIAVRIANKIGDTLKNYNFTRLFYSSSGETALLNLGAYLSRELPSTYSIYELKSIHSLLKEKSEGQKKTNHAILVGGVDFGDAISTATYKDNRNFSENYFQPLEASTQEIDYIQRLFSSYFDDIKIFSGKNATENDLIHALNKNSPTLLHIATHGFYTRTGSLYSGHTLDFSLNRSGIVLSGINNQNKDNPSSNDGLLTALEISQLNLSNTKLAVLTSCQSGLGDPESTEGIIGLQRSLLKAGVNNLVIIMDEVADDVAYEFVQYLYEALEEGKTIKQSFDMAISKLQLTLPFEIWSDIKLIGLGKEKIIAPNSNMVFWIGLFLLPFGILIYLMSKRRRKDKAS